MQQMTYVWNISSFLHKVKVEETVCAFHTSSAFVIELQATNMQPSISCTKLLFTVYEMFRWDKARNARQDPSTFSRVRYTFVLWHSKLTNIHPPAFNNSEPQQAYTNTLGSQADGTNGTSTELVIVVIATEVKNGVSQAKTTIFSKPLPLQSKGISLALVTEANA